MIDRARLLAIVMGCCFFTAASAQPKDADAPIPPREAAVRMTVPDGFKVTLFAGEPDVVQPIGFTFDDRGRLWVAECRSYPKWSKDQATKKAGDKYFDHRQGTDRVLIFEDDDGDGQFDKRTVFADKLVNLSGINYGFGGIWLCSIPNLLFIPDKDGDDKPDGPPEIKLDGWSLNSGHNAFNGIKWGPDGWLYGCNGITATSTVGEPGTPDKERTPINCGVWRYHPVLPPQPPLRKGGQADAIRKGGQNNTLPLEKGQQNNTPPLKKGGRRGGRFEVVAHGTTNPWGLDWDEYGELFITNCVIDHVWHIVPGGHYERMYGSDFNPHLYKLMPSIADHKHWGGGHWTTSRGGQGVHSVAGGGHAHVGCMIYLGDNWPKQYRGGLFTCNLHGNRINHDLLERKGSSYVARHGKDFLFANDPWFRGLGIDYGPDGGVYVSDWTDTGECHNYQVAHTGTGRIYKVVHGTPKEWKGDLAKLSGAELVKLQTHDNEWFVRHARRILQERKTAGSISPDFEKQLWNDFLRADRDPRAKMRLFLTLHVTGCLDEERLIAAAKSKESRYVQTWAIRIGIDELPHWPKRKGADYEQSFEATLRDAAFDASAFVRLHVAAGLQRIPFELRGVMAIDLALNMENTDDTYLPLMIWYAMEPMLDRHEHIPAWLWASLTSIPQLRTLIARRVASSNDVAVNLPKMIEQLGRRDDDPPFHRDYLRGVLLGLESRKNVPMPAPWKAVFPKLRESPLHEVRDSALALALIFGDDRAIATLQQRVLDEKLPVKDRTGALEMLLRHRPPELLPVLQSVLADSRMRSPAIRGLAAYDDSTTPGRILKLYSRYGHDEKSDAIATLSARPEYALALLDAVEKKVVPRQDLNAFMVRQLLALNHPKVTQRVNQVWGTLRSPSADKAARLGVLKKQLEPEALKQANLAHGRALFIKHCAACHKLFGEGGAIGPDLTGSQRTNLDYVLENMLDPSAVVPREYQVQIVLTDGGRTITGIVKEETDRALTMQTQNEVIVVPKDEIDSRRQASVSMMPEGVIEQLRPEELRDLVAYLASQDR